jgi:hypothetical protein
MAGSVIIEGNDNIDIIVAILAKNGYKVWTEECKELLSEDVDCPSRSVTRVLVTNGNTRTIFFEKDE